MSSAESAFLSGGINRRTLLKAGLGAAVGLSLPVRALGKILPADLTEKRLSFYNTHTGESLRKVTFWAGGCYIPESLQDINHILRDHRAGEVVEMDRELLELLHALSTTVGAEKPFHIISGYRSAQTNQLLRKNNTGVAKRSLHMQGRAIDVRIPGISTRSLRRTAMSLKCGGVGFYPESHFVHLDTGRVRYW